MPRKEQSEEVAEPSTSLRRSARNVSNPSSNVTLRKRTASRDSQPRDVEPLVVAASATKNKSRSSSVEEQDENPVPKSTPRATKRQINTTKNAEEQTTQKKSVLEESKSTPIRRRRGSSATSDESIPERPIRTRQFHSESDLDGVPMTRSRRASIDKIKDTPEKIPVKPKPRRRISTTEELNNLELIEEQPEVTPISLNTAPTVSIKLTPFIKKKLSEVVENDLNLSTIVESNADQDVSKETSASLRKSPNKSDENKQISPKRKLEFDEVDEVSPQKKSREDEETTLRKTSEAKDSPMNVFKPKFVEESFIEQMDVDVTFDSNLISSKTPSDKQLGRSSLSIRKSITPKKLSPIILSQQKDHLEGCKVELAAVLEDETEKNVVDKSINESKQLESTIKDVSINDIQPKNKPMDVVEEPMENPKGLIDTAVNNPEENLSETSFQDKSKTEDKVSCCSTDFELEINTDSDNEANGSTVDTKSKNSSTKDDQINEDELLEDHANSREIKFTPNETELLQETQDEIKEVNLEKNEKSTEKLEKIHVKNRTESESEEEAIISCVIPFLNYRAEEPDSDEEEDNNSDVSKASLEVFIDELSCESDSDEDENQSLSITFSINAAEKVEEEPRKKTQQAESVSSDPNASRVRVLEEEVEEDGTKQPTDKLTDSLNSSKMQNSNKTVKDNEISVEKSITPVKLNQEKSNENVSIGDALVEADFDVEAIKEHDDSTKEPNGLMESLNNSKMKNKTVKESLKKSLTPPKLNKSKINENISIGLVDSDFDAEEIAEHDESLNNSKMKNKTAKEKDMSIKKSLTPFKLNEGKINENVSTGHILVESNFDAEEIEEHDDSITEPRGNLMESLNNSEMKNKTVKQMDISLIKFISPIKLNWEHDDSTKEPSGKPIESLNNSKRKNKTVKEKNTYFKKSLTPLKLNERKINEKFSIGHVLVENDFDAEEIEEHDSTKEPSGKLIESLNNSKMKNKTIKQMDMSLKKSLTPPKLNQRKSPGNVSATDVLQAYAMEKQDDNVKDQSGKLNESLNNSKMKTKTINEKEMPRKKSITPLKYNQRKSHGNKSNNDVLQENSFDEEAVEESEGTSKQLTDSFNSNKTDKESKRSVKKSITPQAIKRKSNESIGLKQLKTPVAENLSVTVKEVMGRMEKLEEDTNTKLDEFLATKAVNDILEDTETESEHNQSNSLIFSTTEEGEETSLSEESNEITDEEDEINTTESTIDESEDEYMNDSFICDDEDNLVLQSSDDELSGEGKTKNRQEKTRIFTIPESSEDEASPEVRKEPELKKVPKKQNRILIMSDSSEEDTFKLIREEPKVKKSHYETKKPSSATITSPKIEEPKSNTKSKKRKQEKESKPKKAKPSSLDDLKDGTFSIMNQMVNEGKKKRPVRDIKPSVDANNSSWISEDVLVKPSSSSLQSRAPPKYSVKKPVEFHTKNFKNQMYNACRVRKVDTKKSLQKKGAYL